MELIDISRALYDTRQQEAESMKNLELITHEKAQTEYDYQKAKSMAVFLLRRCGVPVGEVKELVMGIDEELQNKLIEQFPILKNKILPVGDLRFARDLAEGKHLANREGLRSLQSQSISLQSLLKIQKEL